MSKENQELIQKAEQLKLEYLKNNSTKDMLYENGSGILYICKQLEQIKNELSQLKHQLNEKAIKDSQQVAR